MSLIDTTTSFSQAKAEYRPKRFDPTQWADKDASPEGFISDPNQLCGVGADVILKMKEAADFLEKTYPEWAWALNPNPKGQVINLFSLLLHKNWGFVIHMDKFLNDVENRYIKWAAGELLERFNMPRTGFRRAVTAWREAPKAVDGQCIPDRAAVQRAQFKNSKREQINEQIRTGVLVEVKDKMGNRFLIKPRAR